MTSWGQVAFLSYSQATVRISFSAKLWASSRRSFCSSVRVRSTTGEAPLEGRGRRVAGGLCQGDVDSRVNLTGETARTPPEWLSRAFCQGMTNFCVCGRADFCLCGWD